jgi:hypothetical protein
MQEINVLVLRVLLYLNLTEDGDLLPKHVGGYKFMYDF